LKLLKANHLKKYSLEDHIIREYFWQIAIANGAVLTASAV
jgi:hypothetical protein